MRILRRLRRSEGLPEGRCRQDGAIFARKERERYTGDLRCQLSVYHVSIADAMEITSLDRLPNTVIPHQ